MNFFGYLDPGSSTLIIQAVLGGTAGAAVLFKTMGRKFSRKRKTEDVAVVAEDAENAESAEPSVRPQTSD